mmetsp:Transcript_52033/g.58121  ORF Transcript_52033/g.58121 Transcript_52033/m.58121 type:complete len:90 (-) Transcript_52033:39-308(-)
MMRMTANKNDDDARYQQKDTRSVDKTKKGGGVILINYCVFFCIFHSTHRHAHNSHCGDRLPYYNEIEDTFRRCGGVVTTTFTSKRRRNR